ncbi:MAG: hypothetical protein H6742_20440 [Alphaproteobacteria bacterium]|nr:hypothetical protein [Alphaproteobacteria bacterium]
MPAFPDVLPHGVLEPLAPGIHWVRGSVRMGPGVLIPRTMVVLQHEGELTLVSAVRLDDQGIAALDALGRVAHIVKIGTHGMDDAWYLDRYDARLWAAAGMTHQDPTLTIDHGFTADGPFPVPWVTPFLFEQTRRPEAALLAARGHGVLITCDSVQHWPDLEGCSALAKPVTVAMGFLKPANIGPPWRRIMTPPGGSLRPDYERLLALPFDTVVGGHGKPLVGGAKDALRATVKRVFGG